MRAVAIVIYLDKSMHELLKSCSPTFRIFRHSVTRKHGLNLVLMRKKERPIFHHKTYAVSVVIKIENFNDFFKCSDTPIIHYLAHRLDHAPIN